MRYARDSAAGVQVVRYGDTCGYCGWQHCGSRLCPWCGEKLAAADCDRAEGYLLGWTLRGNAIAMVTMTLRHKAEEAPRAVWDAHTKVLDSTHHGRPWERLKAKYGLLEHLYGNECPVGQNGAHKHQHRCWEVADRDELHSRAGRRAFCRLLEHDYRQLYQVALKKHGRSALPRIDLKVTIAAGTKENARKAATYATKLSKEAALGSAKKSYGDNKTWQELLDDAADPSLSPAQRAAARDLYAKLYHGLKGLHWFYCSEAKVEESEEGGQVEIPEKELDDAGEVLLTISGIQAAMLDDQALQVDFLERVEREGPAAAATWMKRFSDPSNWSKQFMSRFYHPPAQGASP